MLTLIFLGHVGTTLFMVGLIWFVQIVHYPLFSAVSRADFGAYQIAHANLTSVVVMPPMLFEAGTALLFLFWRPSQFTNIEVGLGFGLVVIIWLSTFLLQVPQHQVLASGFDAQAHQFLVVSNWVRTIAWSLRGVLVLWLVAKLISV